MSKPGAKRTSLTRKLVLGFVALVPLFAMQAAGVSFTVTQIVDAIDQASELSDIDIRIGQTIHAFDGLTAAIDVVLETGANADSIALFREQKQAATQEVQAIERLIAGRDDLREQWSGLTTTLREVEATESEMLSAVGAGQAGIVARALRHKVVTLHRQTVQDLRKIQLHVREDFSRAVESAHTRRTLVVAVSALLLVAFATVAVVVALVLVRRVVAPIREITRIASRIGAGDLAQRVAVHANDELGDLATTFNSMTENLSKVSQENSRERWLKNGQTELSDRMRGEQDTATLSRNVVTYLAKYLDAQVGALYVAGEDGTLSLTGSYAHTEHKRLNTTFKPGEGLAGQAALEKEPIVVSDLPEDYIAISSGLGDTRPRSLAVIPFVYSTDVKAVVELGALQPFANGKLEFLRMIGENVAIAFSSAQSRRKLQDLLQQTRAQSDELQTANQHLEEQTQSLEEQQHAMAAQNLRLDEARHELEQKARDLEQASQYKSEFLANMSHELRTPLNSLLILAGSLANNREGNLSADQVKSAEIINKSGHDLLHLINDILDLSKVEAGMLDVIEEKVEIRSLTDSLDELFAAVAKERGVPFKIDLDTSAPKVLTSDSQRLQQILKNLLSNAFKFTQQGSVTLRVERSPAGAPIDAELQKRGAIAFSVIDTGIGIPAHRQEAIFAAFQQANGSTSRTYGGTGLGLTISRKLAHLLGGEIEVRSTPGAGSAFTVHLPIEVRAARVRAADTRDELTAPASDRAHLQDASFVADDRANIRPGDRSLLIVEDDRDFAEVLMRLARQRRYKCIAVPDGATALALAAELVPSAIILDIGLAGMNGVEVLEQLKFHIATRHIPVHVISGMPGGESCLSKGAVGFLRKPATAEQFEKALAKVEELMGQRAKHVLLVASNGDGASLVGLLQNNETQVTIAACGSDAVERFAEGAYQCLVVEPQLEDMSAADLLRAIEARVPGKLPPVVIYGSEQAADGLQSAASQTALAFAESQERVLDEVALFLHSVESALSPEQRRVIRMLHDPDKVLRGRRVLLVDDDVRNLFAMSKVLQEQGMEVVMADNGEVALAKLAANADIDLVLMDIMMPVMDGYEAMRRIRADKRFTSLPMVALTAKSMSEDRAKCLSAGASDYLTKPVNVEKLVSVLRIWLFEEA